MSSLTGFALMVSACSTSSDPRLDCLRDPRCPPQIDASAGSGGAPSGSGGARAGGAAGTGGSGAGSGGVTTPMDASASGGAPETDGGTDASVPPGKDAQVCPPSFGDCNHKANDGCETSLLGHPENCGACGHACLGAECHAGRCDAIQLSTDSAQGLAVDATGIYWTSGDGVRTVSRDGGGLRIIARPEVGGGDIALAGGNVYWMDLGNAYFPSSFLSPGLLRTTPILTDGGLPRSLYTGISDDPLFELAGALALDDKNIYWEMSDRAGTGSAFFKMPLAGGAVRRVFPDTGYLARVDVQFMKAHQGHLFGAGGFTEALSGHPSGGWVVRMGTDDGSFQKVWQSDTLAGIALDAFGDYVYFTAGDLSPQDGGAPDSGAGDAGLHLFRLPVNGTKAEELWTGGGLGIAVDATGIYASTQTALRRFPLGGGAPTVLAANQSPRLVVTDDQAVYWANFDAPGGIWKVAK